MLPTAQAQATAIIFHIRVVRRSFNMLSANRAKRDTISFGATGYAHFHNDYVNQLYVYRQNTKIRISI